ncbi:MAG TPA: hypothetical protein VNS22_11045, partial [Geminicoccus sp.]|uniref:hypothetical protein n=1 Tax=Geminicoccus sp. TaxID=2024832 RepID=UPI002BB18E28
MVIIQLLWRDVLDIGPRGRPLLPKTRRCLPDPPKRVHGAIRSEVGTGMDDSLLKAVRRYTEAHAD